MGAGATCMALFALDQFVRRGARDIIVAVAIVGALLVAWFSWNAISPDTVPNAGPLMLIGFVFSLCGGMAIGFCARACRIDLYLGRGRAAGVIFAQQMARASTISCCWRSRSSFWLAT